MKIEEIPFDRIFPSRHELTEQEKANREKFREFLECVRIRATDRYVFPPEILTVDEITVATVGNFSASVGKPKSRKTFNVSAIVAALLSGKKVLLPRQAARRQDQGVVYRHRTEPRALLQGASPHT